MKNDLVYINDTPALSVADIYAKCRYLDNLGLVVIDYLQLMVYSEVQRRDNYYNGSPHKQGAAECVIAKNCHGGTGTVTLC